MDLLILRCAANTRDRLIEKYDIRSSQGNTTAAREMSGGNQQKIVAAREIDVDAFIGTVGLSDYLRPVCCTPFVDSHTALLHLKTEDTGSPTVDAMSLYSMTGVPMGWMPLL